MGAVSSRRTAASVPRLLGVALAAFLAAGWQGARATTVEAAQALAEETTQKLLATFKRERAAIEEDKNRLYALVDEIVLPHFDFVIMSKRVLGKHWRDATPEQRRRFVEEFKTLLVHTYAVALLEYQDQKIVFLPPRERSGGSQASIRMQIEQAAGPTIPINYELYLDDGAWKVYDVAVDGVSLVINFRSTFSSEIRQNGLDGLIARLAEKNQQRKK